MKKLLCGVRDVPARTMIGIPMLFAHVAVATRWFGDLLSDANSVVAKHPLDYELVLYGEYDEAVDAFEGVEPSILFTGRDWLAAKEADA